MDELGTWKAQFEKFQAVAQDLTTQSLELKRKIEQYKIENKKLNQLIKDKTNENSNIRHEREQVMRECEDLAREKNHLKERLRLVKTQNNVLLQQRDEVEGVLGSLRQLIETQPVVLGELLQQTQHHGQVTETQAQDHSFMETAKKFVPEETILVPHHSERFDHARKASLSDAADLIVREKTKEITSLITQMTAECIAALDRIHVNEDDDDGPFNTEAGRTSSTTEDEESVGSSPGSNKRRSDMTGASEAIANLDLDTPIVHTKYNKKRYGDIYPGLPFTSASVQEVRN